MESNTIVLLGLLRKAPRVRLTTSAVDHPAVDRDDILDPTDVTRACGAPTQLVSVMLANNETSAIQPMTEIARAVHHR